MKNPLLRSFNEEILFSELKPEHVSEAAFQTIRQAKGQLEKIISTAEKTFDSILGEWDRLQNTVSGVLNPIYLIAETHPNDQVRNESRIAIEKFSEFLNELSINEDFFQAVKEFEKTAEAKSLSKTEKKFFDDLILNFKRNGFELPKSEREKLKQVKIEIDVLCLEFSKNIGESTGFIELSENEISGLPKDFLSTRKTETGNFRIDLSYPSYHPFMKYSENESRRKELMMMFNNRAYPKNISVLNKILKKRKELAKLLGYKTYADFATEDRMVKSPETVWEFEENLIRQIDEKAKQDYAELLEVKSEITKQKSDVINEWELAFFTNKLKEKKYSVDDLEVRNFFEIKQTINGLFSITETLLGLTYKEIKNPSVWHPEVSMYEVFDNQTHTKIGSFYLDLFPRENKYSHAAMFSIVNGIKIRNDYEKPQAALVCNFPKPTETQPSLLFFSDVKTLFHEFGHLLHGMVTTSPFSLYAGTNTVIDFVETPSQFFENLVYEYSLVSQFAKHYQTGKIISETLVEKLNNAKYLGSGIQTQQQIFYGVYDFTLHHRIDEILEDISTRVLEKTKTEITQFDYAEGDHFQTAFGHLAGYGAGYYSYLWSKVYAQDIWSEFEKSGVSNPQTGIKFRKKILEPGGSVDAFELVKSFLEREPDNAAFLKELGVS